MLTWDRKVCPILPQSYKYVTGINRLEKQIMVLMTTLDKAILKNIAIIIISGHHFTFHCQHLKQRKQFKLFSGRGSVFSEIYFKISVYTSNIP